MNSSLLTARRQDSAEEQHIKSYNRLGRGENIPMQIILRTEFITNADVIFSAIHIGACTENPVTRK